MAHDEVDSNFFLCGIEKYVVQKRPIPIELLNVNVPDNYNTSKRASTLLPGLLASRASTDIGPQLFVNQHNQFNNNKLHNHYPMVFEHLSAKRGGSLNFILHATAPATRKSWLEKIRGLQERKNIKSPVFELLPVIPLFEFSESNKIHHFITFNAGNQYLLAADDGVYVGHYSTTIEKARNPHKLLSLDKVIQIQVIEVAEILLVLLADKTLWEYNLDVVNGNPSHQAPGRLVHSNVPFFCIGQCLQRTLICVPRISTLKSYIYTYEPICKVDNATNTNIISKRTIIPDIMKQKPSQESKDIHFKKIKESYIPSEAYALELSATMMLITSANGVILVDMRTDKAQLIQQCGGSNHPMTVGLLRRSISISAISKSHLAGRAVDASTNENDS
ncbi:hypothetical protein BDB01DRAFT_861321 [Pilobolus umbonatus]|nr:hypothetical protein BDB01DRAFT_861321 [Pilobolus umbonatus]